MRNCRWILFTLMLFKSDVKKMMDWSENVLRVKTRHACLYTKIWEKQYSNVMMVLVAYSVNAPRLAPWFSSVLLDVRPRPLTSEQQPRLVHYTPLLPPHKVLCIAADIGHLRTAITTYFYLLLNSAWDMFFLNVMIFYQNIAYTYSR
jgi:hypothetical protein